MNRRTPPGKNRQRGSVGGVLVTLLFLTAAVSIGAQLVPLYMDHNTMGTIMEKISEENGMALQSDAGLRETMTKRLRLNNIRDFDLKANLSTDRTQRGTQLVLHYEERIHLVANLDLIATFDKKVPLRD